jgi:hypothetical protein
VETSTPRVISTTYRVETNNPDQRDYRKADALPVFCMGMFACVITILCGAMVLQHFGLLNAKGNPVNSSGLTAGIIVLLLSGVNFICISLIAARYSYGVSVDRHNRLVRRWRGPIQRLHPQSYSLDAFNNLRLSKTSTKLRDGKVRTVFRLELTGPPKLELFDTEGEAQIRKLAMEIGDFLRLPIIDETNLGTSPISIAARANLLSVRVRLRELNDIPAPAPIPSRWSNSCIIAKGHIEIHIGRQSYARFVHRLFAEPVFLVCYIMLGMLFILIAVMNGVGRAIEFVGLLTVFTATFALLILGLAHISIGSWDVEVNSNTVRLRTRLMFFPKVKIIPIDSVFDIRNADGTVILVTPEEHVTIGELLTHEEGIWLRGAMLRSIAGV